MHFLYASQKSGFELFIYLSHNNRLIGHASLSPFSYRSTVRLQVVAKFLAKKNLPQFLSFFLSFYFSVGLFDFFSFAVKRNILKRKRNEQRRCKLMGLMVKRLPRAKSIIEARNLSVSIQQVKMIINILRNTVYF